MAEARTLMLQGTASDVGKSLLTAALCRIFKQDGRRVAPFKSQNMSNNSYVTRDGREIGRAQGMQADACGIEATTDMNPILLKPSREMASQVVVHGKPLGDLDARTYRESYLPTAAGIVKEALARLRSQYDVVVLEGAGSPAEINLKDRDIVNMRLAGWADAPVLLVADIDRGGAFAAIVGTLELLEPHERDRVRGIVINKFRGDVSLLQPGIDWLENRIGKPVLGVIPYLPNVGLEDEDSASLDGRFRAGRSTPGTAANSAVPALDVAVIRLPRISNFTDVDALSAEPDVRLRYVTDPREWGAPDAVILPGSKNTAEDLLWLRESGLEARLLAHAGRGGRIAGLCGGYQMLGLRLLDPHGVESDRRELRGLGLLAQETSFGREKRTVRVSGTVVAGAQDAIGLRIDGYEIHMGATAGVGPDVPEPWLRLRREDGTEELEGAWAEEGRIWGTYVHGIFDNDEWRRAWLNGIRRDKGMDDADAAASFREGRERAFDRLADHVRRHLDMPRLYRMMEGE